MFFARKNEKKKEAKRTFDDMRMLAQLHQRRNLSLQLHPLDLWIMELQKVGDFDDCAVWCLWVGELGGGGCFDVAGETDFGKGASADGLDRRGSARQRW